MAAGNAESYESRLGLFFPTLIQRLTELADRTVDGTEAISNARGRQYAAIVVIADLADSQMRHCLHQIRNAHPDTWLIVISDPTVDRARQVVRELGGDATMDVPFTVSDLAQRLNVLSSRARPVA